MGCFVQYLEIGGHACTQLLCYVIGINVWPCKINEQLHLFTSAAVPITVHWKQLEKPNCGSIYLNLIFCPAVIFFFNLFTENAFDSDVEGCMFQGCCLLALQVGVVRKAILFREGFSLK